MIAKSCFTPETNSAPSIRLLGRLEIRRNGAAVALPASRKARALLAHLALAHRAVSRSRLCELLSDASADPRGELRWCLSRIRRLLDGDARRRVVAADDAVRLDLSDCFVDAIEIARAAEEGFAALAPGRQRRLAALFEGDFLDGLELGRAPALGGWLAAERRRFRAWHIALLEQLAKAAPAGAALVHLEKWRELAPFDLQVHRKLLAALALRGGVREGEKHAAATARLFEAEGFDGDAIRGAWRSARAAAVLEGREEAAPPALRRSAVAVMPFADRSATPAHGAAADALTRAVFTRLADLRGLVVVARQAGFGRSMPGADYVVRGSLRTRGARLALAVELAETRTARIVWAETFDCNPDDALSVLGAAGGRIAGSIAREIGRLERGRVLLKPPNARIPA
ncbi:MAG TPA: hypothetical protein VJO54_17490 [Burkholderiales bacterium]|nr:hypothetical protein [Burkholderiales bacterium]